ncbi:MAG: hypothetical protein VR67_03025 [Peptococcaceae bacterium BRH_c8a]|nr:MAG: hypothetical protein VR67_03025 [Peptococcaceae bacterium BRH_c8a]
MMLLSTCNPEDVYSVTEVQKLAHKTVEQAIFVFGGGKELTVLCGRKFGETQTMAPSMHMITSLLVNMPFQLQEAIVFHNHPRLPWHGQVIPSDDDMASTELLKWQLALLGIKLLDHVVLTGDKKRSMLEMGLYDNKALKIKGLEIKRFLYCFLVQLSASLEHQSALEQVVAVLERKLALWDVFYQQSFMERLKNKKPPAGDFKLALIKTSDPLMKGLIDALVQLEDYRSVTVKPDKILPFGSELQRRIRTKEYRFREDAV